MQKLVNEIEQLKDSQKNYVCLKTTFNEMEKRCVKYQKGEIDAKKQLTAYKEFVVSKFKIK